jgi:histidyl-tRNA synthetase
MGDVTLRHFLEGHKLLPKLDPACDVFITIPSAELFTRADELATQLRAAGLRAMTPLESAGFGVQLKQAAKLGARCVVLLGEAEIARGAVAIKELATGTQTEVLIAELGSWLTAR